MDWLKDIRTFTLDYYDKSKYLKKGNPDQKPTAGDQIVSRNHSRKNSQAPSQK
jgi:hypothetical protein